MKDKLQEKWQWGDINIRLVYYLDLHYLQNCGIVRLRWDKAPSSTYYSLIIPAALKATIIYVQKMKASETNYP